MFSNGRKTIGVLTERAISEFQNKLCQGIVKAAEEKGYNVAVFTSFGGYGSNKRYYEGEEQLFELPPYEELDGVIMTLDTIEDANTRRIILNNVRKRCHCPVVSVREVVEGANNLLVDNTTCMQGIIRHFVEDHGFTKLCFMTGPTDHWDAMERLMCFKNMMAQYGLPVTNRQLFFGDFWKNKGKEACDWFFKDGEKPQAIICANDYMAVAVASELISRGYRIPEDICVSGYDGLFDSLAFTPSVTTMAVPFFEMGYKAVEIIDAKQACPEKNEDYYFDAQVIKRESCGCLKRMDTEAIQARRDQHEKVKVNDNRQMQFNFLSINLGDSYDLDSVGDLLNYYIFNVEGLKSYGLMLCEDMPKRKDFRTYTDSMMMRIGMKENNGMGHIKIPFKRTDLIPAELQDEKSQIWYFNPLHFQDNCFGYEAFSFWDWKATGKIHFEWNIAVSNKIQSILVYNQLQQAIEELEHVYNRDALTGMYSRRGFEERGGEIMENAKKEQKTVFLSIIDLDGMKQINDNYGHVEGDHALRVVCQAIQGTYEGENVNARTGGDEFVVVASDITEETGVQWMKNIEKYLDDYNKSGAKPYQIHASFGYTFKVPETEDSLETYIKTSDEMMYENKIANKTRRGDPLR